MFDNLHFKRKLNTNDSLKLCCFKEFLIFYGRRVIDTRCKLELRTRKCLVTETQKYVLQVALVLKCLEYTTASTQTSKILIDPHYKTCGHVETIFKNKSVFLTTFSLICMPGTYPRSLVPCSKFMNTVLLFLTCLFFYMFFLSFNTKYVHFQNLTTFNMHLHL